MKTLSIRAVAKLRVYKDTVFWDDELTDFIVRVYPIKAKAYIAKEVSHRTLSDFEVWWHTPQNFGILSRFIHTRNNPSCGFALFRE